MLFCIKDLNEIVIFFSLVSSWARLGSLQFKPKFITILMLASNHCVTLPTRVWQWPSVPGMVLTVIHQLVVAGHGIACLRLKQFTKRRNRRFYSKYFERGENAREGCLGRGQYSTINDSNVHQDRISPEQLYCNIKTRVVRRLSKSIHWRKIPRFAISQRSDGEESTQRDNGE